MDASRPPPQPAVPVPPEGGVTLVLGGGGFKGMAHLGVLLVLQEAGVPIERVVGSSVGAMLGANFCWFRDARRTLASAEAFLASEGFRGSRFVGFRRRSGHVPLLSRLLMGVRRQVALERIFRRSSALGGAALHHVVKGLVPDGALEDLPIPLAVCALDLHSGERVVLRRGPSRTLVTASCSVPGFFPPVEWGGTLLCDPGLVDNLPTGPASDLGARAIVAVDLSHDLAPLRPDATGLELLLRAEEVAARLSNREDARRADVVVRPALGERHWLDTTDLEQVVAAGASAAQAALPAIRAVLTKRPPG